MRILILNILIAFSLSGFAQVKYEITPNSLGNIKLGDPISKLSKIFPSNSISKIPVHEFYLGGEGEGYLIIINKTDSLMFIWSKDYDKTIGGIICLSEKYKTKDNLGIGTTLLEVENSHPYIYLRSDYNYGAYEYVTVKYSNGFINFQVMNNGNQIGKYDPNLIDEPATKEYDRLTTVDRLAIWK